MSKPGSPQWNARIAAVEAAESQQPLAWWYLSFAEPRKWKGAVIVQARGIMGAVAEANRLGINPGGEVKGARLSPEHTPPENLINRLLSKADIESFPGGVRKW
jgi:hypothetical protein